MPSRLKTALSLTAFILFVHGSIRTTLLMNETTRKVTAAPPLENDDPSRILVFSRSSSSTLHSNAAMPYSGTSNHESPPAISRNLEDDSSSKNTVIVPTTTTNFHAPNNPKKKLAVLKQPKVAAGTKIWVHNPQECKFISRMLLGRGKWEPHVQQAILDNMPAKNGRFVDIGANIGTFSLVMAAAGYQVDAFEPMPYNHELFRESIWINGFQDRLQLHQVAVGDTPIERVCMAPAYAGTPEKNQGNGQIISAERQRNTTASVCVPLIRPDSVVKECPDAIKVDVEGWEVPAMRGLGLGDGGTCRPQVVVHEHVSIYAKEDPFAFLKDDYECFHIDGVHKQVTMTAEGKKDGNYLCKLKNQPLETS